MASLVEVLEQRGVLKRQEIYDVVQNLRAQEPRPEQHIRAGALRSSNRLRHMRWVGRSYSKDNYN